MTRFVGVVASVCMGVFAASSAWAASPDYCAVFAKEFAEKVVSDGDDKLSADRIHDRLYHKCLNMDEEPALPTAYVETPSNGVGAPLAGDERSAALMLEDAAAEAPTVDATAIDEAMVKRTAKIEDDRSKPPPRTGRWEGSGYAMGSPEWKNWCAEHFPNSFDPKTGTILPYETGKRQPCL